MIFNKHKEFSSAVSSLVLSLGSLIFSVGCNPHLKSDNSVVAIQESESISTKQGTVQLSEKYIVILANDVDPADVARDHGINPRHLYRHALKGFSGKFTGLSRAQLIADERVLGVEVDQVVKTSTLIQTGAVWGLDRIDQRSAPLNSVYNYEATGKGVNAYIIDTGIRTDHDEFDGRATVGYDSVGDGLDGQDCNGHGTHVSAIVGGKTYGVAKDVNLIAIRVLDCNGSGYTSAVIAGIDWVTQNRKLPAVANLSLGSSLNSTLDTAVQKMILSGVVTTIAAGNDSRDACLSSPGRVPDAITIGASNNQDTRASWSNYGNCIDWFAPGEAITSAWINSPSASNTISGTSMASPHVAGVAALYLETHSTKSPLEVRDDLFSFTTKNIIAGSNSTNNHLLYSFANPDGPQDLTPPTVSITSPLTGTKVRARATVTLTAIASDSGTSGVQRVEFYSNNVLICTDTTAPYTCAYRTPKTRNALQIQAKAYDGAGNVGVSQFVTLYVK